LFGVEVFEAFVVGGAGVDFAEFHDFGAGDAYGVDLVVLLPTVVNGQVKADV